MVVRVGSGFYLSTALGVDGTDAEGTVITAADLLQVYDIQTDGSITGSNSIMHAGDSIVVDTDSDGDFSDETQTTQTDNERYVGSTITYADGTTSSATIELVTLSDGTQALLVQDGNINAINLASDDIQSITLGTYNTTHDNRYHQGNFNNTITNSVVCFGADTRISTPTGDVRAADIQVGDIVMTADNGPQSVVWVGARDVTCDDMIASPKLRPILIKAGVLGQGMPEHDLIVSPQHRMLVSSKIAKRIFGASEVLVPAIKLVDLDGVSQIATPIPTTYVHILFHAHQIIFANGTPSESLFTGPEAMRALSPAARDEILDLFPALHDDRFIPQPARPVVCRTRDVQNLVRRHTKHARPLLDHVSSIEFGG